MSPVLQCHKLFNVTSASMPLFVQCHQYFSATSCSMSPVLQCHKLFNVTSDLTTQQETRPTTVAFRSWTGLRWWPRVRVVACESCVRSLRGQETLMSSCSSVKCTQPTKRPEVAFLMSSWSWQRTALTSTNTTRKGTHQFTTPHVAGTQCAANISRRGVSKRSCYRYLVCCFVSIWKITHLC